MMKLEVGTLKMVHFSITTAAETGEGSFTITIPSGGRLLWKGVGEFQTPAFGDLVASISVLDSEDQVLACFCDMGVDASNRGFVILKSIGWIDIFGLSGPRLLDAGQKLKIDVKKSSAVVDTFRGNIVWGSL